ncbi:MAG: hypothetical protein ACK41V_23760, partial [Acidovorax sp.]|uniref:hypothetical protein n=1 Tax=Acidovorax sp. TaxID=1872122 RepID=UPI00391DE080
MARAADAGGAAAVGDEQSAEAAAAADAAAAPAPAPVPAPVSVTETIATSALSELEEPPEYMQGRQQLAGPLEELL